MSNLYTEDVSGLNRGLRNLGTILARRPYLQQMASERAAKEQALAQQTQARTDLYRKQGGTEDAKAQEILKRISLVDALSKQSAPAMRALQDGRLDSPEIDGYLNTASAVTGANKGDVVKAFKGGLGTVLSMAGRDRTAALVENPVSVVNNDANNASRKKIAADRLTAEGQRPFNLSPGAGRYDASGKLIVQQPSAAAKRAQSEQFDTVTDKYPAVENDPNKFERTVTRKVPRGTSLSSALGADFTREQLIRDVRLGKIDPKSAYYLARQTSESKPDALQPGAPLEKPAAVTTKKPTRAVAAQYVEKYGKDAKAKLQSEGYDVTGYAD